MKLCDFCQNPIGDEGVCGNLNCVEKDNVFEKSTIIGEILPENSESKITNKIENISLKNNSISSGLFDDPNIFNLNTNLGVSFKEKEDFSDRIPDLRDEGYEIIKKIGQGGMGIVLEAVQLSLDRKVAIKILPPHLAKIPDFVSRFQMEANALARLRHPNIVTIFDKGCKNNIVFFVMEFIEGDILTGVFDLKQAIEKKTLNIHYIKKLGIQIAQGLSYAHKNGIIHRDIKPANILIDSHENAKITDFGIAALRTHNNSSFGNTISGQAMGTYGYMAPEQARDAKGIDQRADIYSFGVVLYECLTGKMPGGIFFPPSRDNPEVDVSWDLLIEKMLYPEKENRFSDLGEVLKVLELISPDPKSPAVITPTIGNNEFKTRETVPGTPNTTPPTICLHCQTPILGQTVFCVSCGKSLKCKCLECNHEMSGGTPFCGVCGLDLRNLFQYEEIKKNTERIEFELSLLPNGAEYFSKIEDTILSWDRLNKLIPVKKNIAEAKKKRDEWLVLFTKQAYENFTNNKFQACKDLLNRIKRIQPDHNPLKNLEKKVSETLQKYKDEATLELKKGSFSKAINVLLEAKKVWGEEQFINLTLNEIKSIQDKIKLKLDSFPIYKQEKKIYAIREELIYLKSLGIPFAWIDKITLQVEQLFQKADQIMAKIEVALEKNDKAKVLNLIDLLLSGISDYPKALLLKNQLLSEKETVGKFTEILDGYLKNHQYLKADKLIQERDNSAKPVSRIAKCEIITGINRIKNFQNVLVTWLLGVFLILFCGIILNYFLSNIFQKLQIDLDNYSWVLSCMDKTFLFVITVSLLPFVFKGWMVSPKLNSENNNSKYFLLGAVALNSLSMQFLSTLVPSQGLVYYASNIIDGTLILISFVLILNLFLTQIFTCSTKIDKHIRLQILYLLIFAGLFLGTTAIKSKDTLITYHDFVISFPYFLMILGTSKVIGFGFSKTNFYLPVMGSLLCYFLIPEEQNSDNAFLVPVLYWVLPIGTLLFSLRNNFNIALLVCSFLIPIFSWLLWEVTLKNPYLFCFILIWTFLWGLTSSNQLFNQTTSFNSLYFFYNKYKPCSFLTFKMKNEKFESTSNPLIVFCSSVFLFFCFFSYQILSIELPTTLFTTAFVFYLLFISFLIYCTFKILSSVNISDVIKVWHKIVFLFVFFNLNIVGIYWITKFLK